jgi:hypothetical protein
MAVTYLLAIHKVADFTKWKRGYGDSLPARQKAGLKEKYLLRSIDDPNEVILLHEAEDIQKVKEFTSSPDLRERMQQSGVLGEPTGYFLSDSCSESPHQQANRQATQPGAHDHNGNGTNKLSASRLTL